MRCLDCELVSFQAIIENHKCPTWSEVQKQNTQKQTELIPEPEQQQLEQKPGEWLLEK